MVESSPMAGVAGTKGLPGLLPENPRKVFATDIDSVLLDISTPLEQALAKLYPERAKWMEGFMHGPIGMWDLGMAFGLGKDEMDAVWDEAFSHPNYPYPDALFFINRLKELGFDVIGVSTRGGPRFLTPAYRDTPVLGLDKIIFLGHSIPKGPTVHALNADYFIDDKIGNLLSVAEYSPTTQLFLMDQPWNVSLDLRVPYTRVYSLGEVVEVVGGRGF